MLVVDEINNREFLRNLFLSMYDELPVLKKTSSKNSDKKP